LNQVQLFDQDGNPLYTVEDSHTTTSENVPDLVPNNDVIGRRGWNVYPLLEIPPSELNSHTGLPKKGAIAIAPNRKHQTVPSLANQPAPTPAP
jgi:hypothetical protein